MNITRFFADGEHAFKLTPALIGELERKCEAGIGLIQRRVMARQFHFADVAETIRLALIGGGALPHVAAVLVDVYVGTKPLEHDWALAVEILDALFNGPRAAEAEGEAA